MPRYKVTYTLAFSLADDSLPEPSTSTLTKYVKESPESIVDFSLSINDVTQKSPFVNVRGRTFGGVLQSKLTPDALAKELLQSDIRMHYYVKNMEVGTFYIKKVTVNDKVFKNLFI